MPHIYITLHYITLHYITLHYITLHYITLHYITLHYITLHYITLHYITLHYITLHYITLHYITLHYITLHYITLHYIHTYIHEPLSQASRKPSCPNPTPIWLRRSRNIRFFLTSSSPRALHRPLCPRRQRHDCWLVDESLRCHGLSGIQGQGLRVCRLK